MKRLARLTVATLLGGAALALPAVASAHPLGNFTINHYSGILVGASGVEVDHVLDMAEIPTFSERRDMDTDRDGAVSDAEAAAYAERMCGVQAAALDLTVGGGRVSLQPTRALVSFPQGQGALTLRLECALRGDLADGLTAGAGTAFRFDDPTYAPRRGWREIVVTSDGTTLSGSTAPTSGSSGRLTHYPTDLLTTPLAMGSATWSATLGGPAAPRAAAPEAAAPEAERSSGSSSTVVVSRPGGEIVPEIGQLLDQRELTLPVGALLVLVAAGLGAVHALSPGHGKTVMAAYLVGSRGSVRQALGLGLAVTVSHTLGVLALGAVTVAASSVIPVERLYPILATVSGIIVVALGAWLLLSRLRVIAVQRAAGRDERLAHDRAHAAGLDHDHDHGHGHDHEHDHGHGHDHHGDGEHDHGHAGQVDTASPHVHPHGGHADDDGVHSHGPFRHNHAPTPASAPGWKGLVCLGLAGGMVPSVSALILLLGSVAMGRPAFGLLLTVCFGIGMAAVLVGVGAALVVARRRIEGLATRGLPRRVAGLMPMASAVVVLTVGVVLTGQALATWW